MEEGENLQKWNSLFLRLPSVKNQHCISIFKSERFYRKAAKTFPLSSIIKQWNLNTKAYFNYGIKINRKFIFPKQRKLY